MSTTSSSSSTLSSLPSSAAIEKREQSLLLHELTPPSSSRSVYKNFLDLKQRIANLSLDDSYCQTVKLVGKFRYMIMIYTGIH